MRFHTYTKFSPEMADAVDLQSLLDACVRSESMALVRVEIVGASGGERRRLVLDFGQFGREEE